MAEGGQGFTDYILGRGKRSAPVETDTNNEEDKPTGSKNDGTVEEPQLKKIYNVSKFVFKHRRIMSTFGYQYTSVSAPHFADDFGSKAFFITTPYARVPCHGIPFYLTQAEFMNLPRGSEVKLCKVKCKPIGFRTPFLTNSAAVSQVNSSMMIHGMYAFGLNNKYGGGDFMYTSDINSPCIPTDCDMNLKEDCDPDKFWGKRYSSSSSAPSFSDIGTNFGKELPLSTYYTKLHSQTNTLDEWLDNSMDDINIFTMTALNMNGPEVNWEYRPQICIIKPTNTLRGWQRNEKDKWESKVLYGTKVPNMNKVFPWRKRTNFFDNIQIDTNSFQQITRGATSNDTLLESGFMQFYTSYIEHSGSQTHGLSEYGGGVQPPSLHIGMLPINTWYSKPDVKAIMPATTQWMIESEIHIEASNAFIDPWMCAEHPNTVSMCSISDLQIGFWPLTQFGYKSGWHSLTSTSGRNSMAKDAPADPTTPATPTTSTPKPGSGRLSARWSKRR